MKILVTGGAGFIGNNLVRELSAAGNEVYIIDNLLPQVHGENAKFPVFSNNVKCIQGDIRNQSLIRDILTEGFDFIYHLVALTGVGQSMYDIREYVDVSSLGTAILLEEIVKSKHFPKKIILSSSRAVYGEGACQCSKCGGIFYPKTRDVMRLSEGKWEHPCPECGSDGIPIQSDETFQAIPTSIYGVSKYHQEQLCAIVSNAYGIPMTILRYFNVYGPGQSPINPYTGVLSIFCRRLIKGQNIEIYEDGLQARDFVYIDDVVQANILAAQSNATGIFNVCSGEQATILEIVHTLLEILGERKNTYYISGHYRVGDIRHGIGTWQKAGADLNYQSSTSLKIGLQQLVEWMLNQEINLNKDMDLIAAQELTQRGLLK